MLTDNTISFSLLRGKLWLLLLLLIISVPILSQQTTPFQVKATANVNIRKGPGTQYAIKTSIHKGDVVTVVDVSYTNWYQVQGQFGIGWLNAKYVTPYTPDNQTSSASHASAKKHSSRWHITLFDIIKWAFYVFLIFVFFAIVASVFEYILGAFVVMMWIGKWIFRLAVLPFFISNALQRYLAKPWMLFFHYNHFSDSTNHVLRIIFTWLKVPLYILLTPVRFVNAVFFNLVVHCPYELFNYALEIVVPTLYEEGYYDAWDWIKYLPKRLWKYGIWHPALTITESIIWTMIDTVLPALTLYHGTTPDAAESIVSCPSRTGSSAWDTGVWNVGGGNFAGNGIYFAPARSTSEHYARGVMIVCRVTLGRTLDLGLAPRHVYRECGHSNALSATNWGLRNGYVTGEWWRSDAKWWEYCMYDWQNRYNYSWRIRPLYVVNLESGFIHRNPCGMSHWFFREMVLSDLKTSIFGIKE